MTSHRVLREPLDAYSIGALVPDAESERFWELARAGTLVVQACRSCGLRQFPPLPRCRRCHGDDLGWERSEGTGVLRSWVVIRHALLPKHAQLVPFAVGLVELEPGVRIVALLDVPPDALVGDMPVRVESEPTAGGAVLVGRL